MAVIYHINIEQTGYVDGYLLSIEKNKAFRIRVEKIAYYLLKEQRPYEDLCWELAEFQLIYEKGKRKYNERDVRKKAAMLNEISPSYRELCWLIATYKVYLKEKKIYP